MKNEKSFENEFLFSTFKDKFFTKNLQLESTTLKCFGVIWAYAFEHFKLSITTLWTRFALSVTWTKKCYRTKCVPKGLREFRYKDYMMNEVWHFYILSTRLHKVCKTKFVRWRFPFKYLYRSGKESVFIPTTVCFRPNIDKWLRVFSTHM